MADTHERIEVGKYIYVWRKEGSPASASCLISAHGGTTLINRMKPLKRRRSGMDPDLHFYTPHGHSVNDVGMSAFKNKTETEVLKPAACPEYMLSKYTNTGYSGNLHNKAGENYFTVAYTAKAVDYDIVTIRNRYDISAHFLGIGLSEVLDELEAAGFNYTDIYCAFCRGGKPEPA
jgi:hypothetical protein